MSDVLIDQDTMEDIGDSIRSKLGVQTTYLPSEMPSAIMSISGGGNEMELTKAEYDALSEAEKTNGTTYYITDAQSWTSKEVQPVIYSLEEREVGVWIDGKPLYQRAFDLGQTLNISYTAFTNTTIDASAMETIVDAFGVFHTGIARYNLMANIGNGVIQLQADRNGAVAPVRYVCLQYTKTTDTAGSGIYTPQGQLAVHYSTEEHVIGTWIDGKPVYEKVYSGLSISCANAGTWYATDILWGDIKTIVESSVIDVGGQVIATTVGNITVSNVKYIGLNSSISYRTFTDIIIRYTKTTD